MERQYGCGFSTIALGDGVIDIKGVCEVLKDCDIASSTLEIVGEEDILKRSVSYLARMRNGRRLGLGSERNRALHIINKIPNPEPGLKIEDFRIALPFLFKSIEA